MELLIATSNQGKVAELRALLKEFHFILHTPEQIGISDIPEEVGSTYLENASLKAQFYFEHSQMPVLADDTGLEVAALNGQPGLYSARFSSKKNASDAERRKLLLEKLTDKPKPWVAQFTCTAVLVDQQGQRHSATGRCEGVITSKERGKHGFGYDQLFLFPALRKTMAELELSQKNQISHRAHAIQALIPEILKLKSDSS